MAELGYRTNLLIGKIGMSQQGFELIAIEVKPPHVLRGVMLINDKPSGYTGWHSLHFLHLTDTDKTSQSLAIIQDSACQDGADAWHALQCQRVGSIGINNAPCLQFFRT